MLVDRRSHSLYLTDETVTVKRLTREDILQSKFVCAGAARGRMTIPYALHQRHTCPQRSNLYCFMYF
ncbi:hypothetical protein JOY44_09340 [Phormidium sp. CLA17]|nr:hypothetical protein [Leptolyngbya sp. Cla-17]